MATLEEQALAREWFYEFELPSGQITKIRSRDVLQIHSTRLQMLWEVLDTEFGNDLQEISAIDTASHEGFFSFHLARRCSSVRGFEINSESVAAARLMRNVLGLANVDFIQADLEELDTIATEAADVVLAFGLIYHLENPLRVLRKLRALTRRLLLLETQTVMLELSGNIDWGHHLSQTPLHGIFGIVEEVPGSLEGGASTISLVPSEHGIRWILRRLGFARVEIVSPPPGCYPQLATGRRIMVAAYL